MRSFHTGTAELTDDAFVEAFESCRLPAASFHHADHIRLAWIYLGRMTEAEATQRIEEAIRRFAAHNGVTTKYHHTITVAWMRLVAAARTASPQATRFDEFAAMNPELLDADLIKSYYSSTRLAASDARTTWTEPDLRPLQ